VTASLRASPLIAVAAVLSASIAWSHHSVAEYDRSVLHELEGTLVDVQWRNPHVAFTLRETAADGSVVDWRLETSALYPLKRAGLTEELFAAGAKVRAAGWISTRRPTLMNVANMLLPSGEEVLFYAASRKRWSENTVGGEWQAELVTDNRRDLYRIWSPESFGAYQASTAAIDIELTPAAAALTPETSPIDPCRPQGMPGVMVNPLPIQFVDRGDHIELRLTAFGVVRRIDLAAPESPAPAPLSDLGKSVGTWVDNTLTIRTTRIGWPYLDDAGRPQSEGVEVVERYQMSSDGSRLAYTQTVTDPATLIAPMSVSWEFVDLGETQIEPLRCE